LGAATIIQKSQAKATAKLLGLTPGDGNLGLRGVVHQQDEATFEVGPQLGDAVEIRKVGPVHAIEVRREAILKFTERVRRKHALVGKVQVAVAMGGGSRDDIGLDDEDRVVATLYR